MPASDESWSRDLHGFRDRRSGLFSHYKIEYRLSILYGVQLQRSNTRFAIYLNLGDNTRVRVQIRILCVPTDIGLTFLLVIIS